MLKLNKKVSTLLLTALIFSGVNFTPSQSASEGNPDTEDKLGKCLIGMTTLEMNKYNFHNCYGAMISKEENEKYAVSQLATNIANCNGGKSKFVIEKFLNYYDKTKANFEVKAEMMVTSDYPKKCYSVITQQLPNEAESKWYLIEFEDNLKPELTQIYKMWEIDIASEKFVAQTVPKNFTCYNPGYSEE